jgi:hypothetical protein
VFHQEEFLNLASSKLKELTSSDHLQVEKEEAVFEAIARWFNHNPDARKDDFPQVCSVVRFNVEFCYVYLLIFTRPDTLG